MSKFFKNIKARRAVDTFLLVTRYGFPYTDKRKENRYAYGIMKVGITKNYKFIYRIKKGGE